MRKIFPSSAVFLCLFLIDFSYSIYKNSFSTLFFCLLVISIIIGFIAFYLLSKRLFSDLRQGQVIVRPFTIQEKVHKKEYEPGSASLGGPFSYYLNKKLPWFRHENKEIEIFYIVVDEERIYLTETEFKMIENKDRVNLRLTKEAGISLGLDEMSISN